MEVHVMAQRRPAKIRSLVHASSATIALALASACAPAAPETPEAPDTTAPGLAPVTALPAPPFTGFTSP